MAEETDSRSHGVRMLTYAEHHATLVSYLLAKVARGDWHGVSDAANDLRELEAEQRGRDSLARQ